MSIILKIVANTIHNEWYNGLFQQGFSCATVFYSGHMPFSVLLLSKLGLEVKWKNYELIEFRSALNADVSTGMMEGLQL